MGVWCQSVCLKKFDIKERKAYRSMGAVQKAPDGEATEREATTDFSAMSKILTVLSSEVV